MKKIILVASLALGIMFSGCSQEMQNKFGRSVQNWTGSDGVLDIYMGEKLVQRYIKIGKFTTAVGTDDNMIRNYRYAYGYLDTNFNYKVDKGENKIYFEVSNFSTPYIFYSNPQD